MKHLRTFLIILFFIVATFFLTDTPAYFPEDAEGYYVERVVDGDTIIAQKGDSYRVRFIGVDTPETVHPSGKVEPWGKEASNFTKKSLEGKTIYLEFDEEEEDHYGRKLAYVWMENPKESERSKEDILFNYKLVSLGYARERAYPPNTKYQNLLKRGEDEAIDSNKGLWAIEGDMGPAKGNKNSMLYHMPGDPQYGKIKPNNVIMFDTAKQAEKAGYQRAFRR